MEEELLEEKTRKSSKPLMAAILLAGGVAFAGGAYTLLSMRRRKALREMDLYELHLQLSRVAKRIHRKLRAGRKRGADKVDLQSTTSTAKAEIDLIKKTVKARLALHTRKLEELKAALKEAPATPAARVVVDAVTDDQERAVRVYMIDQGRLFTQKIIAELKSISKKLGKLSRLVRMLNE